MNSYKLTLKEIHEASKGMSGQDQGILKLLKEKGAPVITHKEHDILILDPMFMMEKSQEPDSLEITFEIKTAPVLAKPEVKE